MAKDNGKDAKYFTLVLFKKQFQLGIFSSIFSKNTRLTPFYVNWLNKDKVSLYLRNKLNTVEFFNHQNRI